MDSTPLQGYTGAYRDTVTGAYPLGNGYRCHLPSVMRFAAPDSYSPFGAGGVNAYAYCGADPINRADPGGHFFDLGEVLGDAARDTADAARAPERTEAQKQSLSLSATYARDWTATQGLKASSADAWERKELESAAVLKRGLGSFLTRRKSIPEQLPALASAMGRKMTEADDFEKLLAEGRIVVSITVKADDVYGGHSALFHEFYRSEVVISALHDPAENRTALYALGEDMAQFLQARGFKVRKGEYAGIKQDMAFSTSVTSLVRDLVKKDRVYVLDGKYGAYFRQAYDEEGEYYAGTPLSPGAPFSYGLHYNCHVYVYNILRRMRRLAGG